MIQSEDVLSIKNLLQEYAPQTMRYELEEWVATKLFDTYHDNEDPHNDSIRFNDTVIKYLPGKGYFNIIKPIEDSITEFSLSVNMMLSTYYGADSLKTARKSLSLMEADFELLAMQLTDEFFNFESNINLVARAQAKGLL